MRALIDLDGTLIDTVYAHVFAWKRALAEAGLPIDGWRIHRRKRYERWSPHARRRSRGRSSAERRRGRIDPAETRTPVPRAVARTSPATGSCRPAGLPAHRGRAAWDHDFGSPARDRRLVGCAWCPRRLLDGIIEHVVAEIEIPAGADWRAVRRRRAASARDILSRHSRAIGLLESGRSMGRRRCAISRRFSAFCDRRDSRSTTPPTPFWLLDSYVHGHVVQETNLSRSGSAETAALAGPGFEPDFGGDYPHLAEPQSAPSAPHSASMASSSTVSSLS